MNCPVCSLSRPWQAKADQPFIILELNQVEVDYCPACSGIWLDEGELELLLEDTREKNILFNSFAVDKHSSEKRVKCPICGKKMEKVVCGNEKKIILDKCVKQHGMWFNKGELEAVVEIGTLDKQNKIVSLLREMFSYNLK